MFGSRLGVNQEPTTSISSNIERLPAAKHLRFNSQVEQAIAVDAIGDGLVDRVFITHSPQSSTYRTIAKLPAAVLRSGNASDEPPQGWSVDLGKAASYSTPPSTLPPLRKPQLENKHSPEIIIPSDEPRQSMVAENQTLMDGWEEGKHNIPGSLSPPASFFGWQWEY